jgi:hypothetical protein
VANNQNPAYEPSKLDEARELLHCQARIVREALDRCERAERALSECRTALHWAERATDRVRETARNAAPSGVQALSEALRGLPGHTGDTRGRHAAHFANGGRRRGDRAAIVDLDARAVLAHLAGFHSPDYFRMIHTTMGLRIQHDSAHILATASPG